jgi:hypothetical protein
VAACDRVLALAHSVQGVTQGVCRATHVLRQRRHIGKAVHRTGRLCFTKIRKFLGKGEQAVTHKVIEPMAPAFNPQRFTDAAKVDKWFRRNCKDVLSRECTAREKADVLAWLISLK